MKAFLITLLGLIVIFGLFLFFGKKASQVEQVGFQANIPQSPSRDSVSITKKSDMQLLSTYNIGYENDEALEYLYPTLPSTDQLVVHQGYTLAYNESNEVADWVAYVLDSNELQIHRNRSNDFQRDPFVSTVSALPNDYWHSGFDRGHLAPAADMQWSSQAMKESFYMSNMSPQVPGFNRGIWKDLEEQVRIWAKLNSQVFIVTGPVYSSSSHEKEYIGANQVAIPDAFYKIIFDYKQPEIKVISFLIPNEDVISSYQSFTRSIDEIEKKTGLDFFPQLPDSIEMELESLNSRSGWFN